MQDETIILGLDGSTPTLSLALVQGGERILASEERGVGESHSMLLPSILDVLLEKAGITVRDLSSIAVGIGPGSFTGLRVILAAAKGIAYAARIPLQGVSSLEAMALAASRLVPEARALVPVLDARKQEVYAGLYRRGEGGVLPWEEGRAEVVMSPVALAERLSSLEGGIAIFGQGYQVYQDVFDGRLESLLAPRVTVLHPPAAAIATLASALPRSYSKEAVFSLEPEYIRSSDAELSFGKARR